MKDFITAGELAKLASTSKRTIQFYDKKGILKPALIGSNGYRYYKESQVLEFQMILLLTTLGITLADIQRHLSRKGDLSSLFDAKKQLIQNQINELQFNLNSIDKFTANLEQTGTMVNPTVKTMKLFGVYYVEKIGSYANIDKYCRELVQMFTGRTGTIETLAIFEEQGYRPKKSRIKIGVLAKPGILIKPVFRDKVKFMRFNPGKVIAYMHNGSGSLLSLFWKELERYC